MYIEVYRKTEDVAYKIDCANILIFKFDDNTSLEINLPIEMTRDQFYAFIKEYAKEL